MRGKKWSYCGGQGLLAQSSFNTVIGWWVGLDFLPVRALWINGNLQEGLCQGVTFWTAAASTPVLVVSPCWLTSLQDILPTKVVLVQLSFWVTAPFLWVLVDATFCLCPPRLQSVSPVLWKSCNQIPFKARFPRDSQSLCWIPSLESLRCGPEPSQQWEN